MQNRKAQQAFRERKDKAIQRLEKEVERLTSINRSLNLDNESRLCEIAELKAELESRSETSGSPIAGSYFEGWEGTSQKCDSFSSETSPSITTSPVTPSLEATTLSVPWIKWRGKLYVDKDSMTSGQTKGFG